MPEHDIYTIKENFELEIHSFKGSWWVRYGIVATFIIILIIVVLAAVVQYPQHVAGVFRLYSKNSALNIPLQQGRKIDRILVEEGNKVLKGQIILSYDDNASLADIENVESIVDKGLEGKESFYQLYRGYIRRIFKLGSLQESFVEINNLMLENYLYLEYAEAKIKIKNIKEEVENYRVLKKETSTLLQMDKAEVKLMEELFMIDSILYSEKVIPKAEYLKKSADRINKTKLHQQDMLSFKRTEAEITKLTNAIRELESKEKENIDKIQARIRSSLAAFKVEIGKWKEKNLIIAQVEGRVNFMGYFNEDEVSLHEDNSIIITPPSTVYKALVEIPFNRAGEVKEGRKVLLKLDDFPYREYGILEGKLASVSHVAGKESYRCEVSLQNLKTNQGEKISFRERMGGMAQIITEDRSILEILFDKIIYIFKN